MQVDSLPTAPAGQDTAAPAARMDGVISMEDFERKFKAQQAASKATPAPSAPVPKITAAPVALGARTTKYTQELHQKYQALGISQPVFLYERGAEGWRGEVSIPGLHDDLQGIREDKIYSSKQQVKEELSARALEILERLEKSGTVKKAEKSGRPVPKFTVAVHDKAQKLGIPQPFFTYEGSNADGWNAQVTFPTLEASIPDLEDEVSHAKKAEAKEALCKQVLEALETAEANGMFQFTGKARGPAQQAAQEKEEPVTNYVGQLLGTSSLSHPTPSPNILLRIPPRHKIPRPNLRRLRHRHPVHLPPHHPLHRLLRLHDRAVHLQKDRPPRSRTRRSRALQSGWRLARRVLRPRRHQKESKSHRIQRP